MKDINDYTADFQRGEEAGFTFFFNSLYPALHYYAYRILQDKDEAEDKVQEQFIKIWERHKSFSHPQVIKSWLYTSVRNACLNHLQAEERQRRHKDIIAAQSKTAAEPISDYIIQSEVYSEIYNLFENLPPECRKVFKGLYIDGLDTTLEVAKTLGISWSTAKSQKARGLGILRKIFSKLEDNEQMQIEKALAYCAELENKNTSRAVKNRKKINPLWEKVFILFKTMPPKEIASILNLSPNTVYQYLYRYRKLKAA